MIRPAFTDDDYWLNKSDAANEHQETRIVVDWAGTDI